MPFPEMPPLPQGKRVPGKIGQFQRLAAKEDLARAGKLVKSGWENVVTKGKEKGKILAYSFRNAEQGL